MAHTKQLLDAMPLDDLVQGIEVVKESFNDQETGRTVDYNRLKITLINGDETYLKFNKDAKLAIFYALRESEKD